jgi:hypothetical protein
MNLPSTMEKYGPITNLWEGGYMGEKFSQELMHRLKWGLKGNWHITFLTNVLKQDSMSRIKLPTDGQMWVNQRECQWCYTTYKHALDAITWYNKREPIPVVFFSDGDCGPMLHGGNEYVKISLYPGTIVLNDLHCWSITIADKLNTKDDKSVITNCCILLPKLCKSGLPRPAELNVRYTILESIWLWNRYGWIL